MKTDTKADDLLQRLDELTKAIVMRENQAMEIKCSFFSNISHEVRNPLNAISGFADLLAEAELPESTRKQYSEYISNACERLLATLDSILLLSQIQNRTTLIKNSAFSVYVLLTEIRQEAERMRLLLSKENFVIDFGIIHNPELVCHSDRGLLKQVLLNIIQCCLKNHAQGYIDFGLLKNENQKLYFYVQFGDKRAHSQNFRQAMKTDEAKNLGDQKLLGEFDLVVAKELIEYLGGEIENMQCSTGKKYFCFSIANLVT